jgi:hypothetical protein
MARVFISYRRADGQYAVGWIEERLRLISGDAEVTTAFRDSDLRYGDNFPDRLALEVHECDVLIAVIGQSWRGDDGGAPARILDPSDWVGREITSALDDPYKLIVPVLLSGVEPLQAGELHPHHKRFADLHALRFNVREDLEELAEQVAEHLTCLEKKRIHALGLDKELPKTPWLLEPTVVLTALLAAVAGAIFSWFVKNEIHSTHSTNLAWRRFSAVQAAYWFAAFVIGRAFVKDRLVGLFDVKWQDVARVGGISVVLIVVGVTSYAPGDNGQLVLTLVEVVIAVLLLSPWVLALVGASWTTTDKTAILDRAILLAKQRHALGLATAVLVIPLGLVVCTNATLLEPNPGISTGFALVGFGVFLSAMVMVGVEYGHSAMREDSERLCDDIEKLEEIKTTALKNMQPALIDGRVDLRPRIALLTVIPAVVAIVTALVVM